MLNRLVKCHSGHGCQKFLCEPDGRRAHLMRDLVSDFTYGRVELLRLDGLRDQSDARRLPGIDLAARQEELACRRLADLPEDEYGDDGGNKPDAYLRESESRVGLRDLHVTDGGESASAGDRVT